MPQVHIRAKMPINSTGSVERHSLSSKSIGSPKIGVESFILMIEHILVSILFDLTRATLLSLRNTLTLL